MESTDSSPSEGAFLLSKFQDLDDIADAAKALKHLVDIFSSESGSLVNNRYRTEACCLELLRREPELHRTMKYAHATKSYDTIRTSVLIRNPGMPRRAQNLMEKIRPLLAELIRSEQPFSHWSSPSEPSDPDTVNHIASLKIPTLQYSRPMVILQDLGNFSQDPVLKSRVGNIFVKGKRTVVVNTSGSGKTRLLFEGLCHEWGFYFTSKQDSSGLGSYDLHRVINRTLTDDPKFLRELDVNSPYFFDKLEYNHLVAYRRFSETLFARLLIFHMFLEITTETGNARDHKIRWLLLQLDPRLGNTLDIFDDMTIALEEPQDIYTWANVSDTLRSIQKLMGADFHLFFAIDEAQSAADRWPAAFHSDPGTHPVLVEMLNIWESHCSIGSTSFIIAGTEIPSKIFKEPRVSENLRWTSDTGAFDDRSLHEKYLRGFLPPAFLASTAGEEFLHRAWRWTRGRHRYAAALAEYLLAHTFRSPHRLLDVYIENASRFEPTDGQRATAEEPLVLFDVDVNTMDFSRLDWPANLHMKTLIQDTVFHYLAVGSHLPTFDADKTEVVSLDYGRFIDGEMKKILVDEPIVLAGAAMWMNWPVPRGAITKRPLPIAATPSHNHLASLQRHPPQTAKTFAKCLAFYFSRAFNAERAVSDIFTFSKAIPAWAQQPAELVELHATEGGRIRYSVISRSEVMGRPLGTSAQSVDEIVAWMEHKHRTAFCIPATANPDLLFVLRLEDGAFIWVILQATAAKSDGSDLLPSLRETSLFCDEEGDPESSAHNRALELLDSPPVASAKSKSTIPTVLRVVASFHDQIDFKARAKKAAPQASLSMEMFRELSAAVSPADIVGSIVATVLGKRKENPDPGKGKGRGKKRRNSFPVDSDDESEEHEVAKGKSDAKKRVKTPEPTTRVLRSETQKKDVPLTGKGKGKGKAKLEPKA